MFIYNAFGRLNLHVVAAAAVAGQFRCGCPSSPVALAVAVADAPDAADGTDVGLLPLMLLGCWGKIDLSAGRCTSRNNCWMLWLAQTVAVACSGCKWVACTGVAAPVAAGAPSADCN